MRKSKKKNTNGITIEEVFELLENEISSYDIRENGAMEKKMTLVKFKKELQKYIDSKN